MTLYKNKTRKLYLIQIPRTGSTYASELIMTSCHAYEWEMMHRDISQYHHVPTTERGEPRTFWTCDEYKGIMIPALHYPLYNELEGVKDAEKLAIIRNPFERFKSAMRYHAVCYDIPAGELQLILEDKKSFKKYVDLLKNHIEFKRNFFRPQREFLSDDVRTYKVEDGLSENFINWMEEEFGIHLNDRDLGMGGALAVDIEPEEIDKKKGDYTLDFNEAIEANVKAYYKKDYEVLGY